MTRTCLLPMTYQGDAAIKWNRFTNRIQDDQAARLYKCFHAQLGFG